MKLLKYVYRLLPRLTPVTLVGDCEFGRPLLLENLRFWGWDYALRQPGDNLVMLRGTGTWQQLDHFVLTTGQPIWIGRVLLTQASPFPTHLLLYWQVGEDKPWYPATNLLDPRAALRLYRRRMWIEARFDDMKKHGFDLEGSYLRHFQRLSRLTPWDCNWPYGPPPDAGIPGQQEPQGDEPLDDPDGK